MEKREEVIISFFKELGLPITKLTEIEGTLITREMLLNDDKYNSIKNHIPQLKKIFSSTFLTSLQKTAQKNQKWPLLNLTRQIFTQLGYNMVPHRKSDGKDATGKKKYKRFFIVEKTKVKELDKEAPKKTEEQPQQPEQQQETTEENLLLQ